MASVILKTTADLNVCLANECITLKGFGVINALEDSKWQEVKKHSAVADMLANGYIVESSKNDNAKADLVSDIQKKQTKSQGKNIKVEK